jgi:predicted transcriptional regulator
VSATIPLSLPDDIAAQVDAISRADGVSRTGVIMEALDEYLAARRFHEIRKRVVPQAQGAGVRHGRGRLQGDLLKVHSIPATAATGEQV